MRGRAIRSRGSLWTNVVSFVASIIVALLVLATLTSCEVGDKSDSWTICLYLCGSNLESRQGWGTMTLDEICGARIPANTNVVIQAGGARKWHSGDVLGNGARFVVENHKLVSVGDAGDVSMGEASTLADFLSFCEQKYPADHVAVILWDHGGGPLKGACYDETRHFDALALAELDEAFKTGVQSRGGRPYDIVGFDACLMGSLETAATLSDDALWMVGSEEVVAGAGWDYAAMLKELRKSRKAPVVAEAICNGYMAKCALRDKDAAATLSVVDLSKVPQVVKALDTAIAGLEGSEGAKVQALRHLAFGTRSAEFFGGSTEGEGRSNLVDLKGMAEGNAVGSVDGGAAWKSLAQAVDEAVTYRVHGSTTKGANGLSLWYPQKFDKDALASYVEASPLVSYSKALAELFDSSMGEVRFADAGSVDDEGKLSVKIDPATSDMLFDLYVVNEAVDGSYRDTNVDISDNWDNLTFAYNPATAVAITLDGMVLDASIVAYEHEYEVFSAPVVVDGEETNLRIAWIWDESETAGGYYKLLGVWNGIDYVTGVTDRPADGLRRGSTVEALSTDTGEARQKIVVGKEVKLSNVPLAPGRYECHFVAQDLMGNEYPSDTCTYEVDNEGTTHMVSIGP